MVAAPSRLRHPRSANRAQAPKAGSTQWGYPESGWEEPDTEEEEAAEAIQGLYLIKQARGPSGAQTRRRN